MSDIIFFRHADANYKIGKVKYNKKFYLLDEFLKSFKDIADIKSFDNLEKYLHKLFQNINFSNYQKIHLWVSPLGRTVDTAKYIINKFKNENINIDKVVIFDILEEVKNFSWEIHKALIEGGKINLNGKEIYIDKNKSNPNNLDFTRYFFSDEVKRVYKRYKDYFNAIGISNYIINVEKYENVVKRYYKIINRLYKYLNNGKYLVIIVTHQALTDELILNNYKKYEGVYPGEFVLLNLENNYVIRGKEIK